jgi:hypothetical protein
VELAGQDGDAKLLGELPVERDTMTVAELQKRQCAPWPTSFGIVSSYWSG